MFYDVVTIMQKELKEIIIQRGSVRGGIANLLIVIAVGGILFPLQNGADWISNPVGLVSVSWLPLFMSMGLVADAFAGERERHTLETLLASRLSDQAILFGKISAAVVYGLGIGIACMLLGAVTVNISSPGAGFYPIQNFLGAVLFSLLGMLLVSASGVLVSLHANTVRQAYQRMSLGFLLLWLPLILGPQLLPDDIKMQLSVLFSRVNGTQAVLFGGILLALIDAALIAAAVANFRRSQLILD